MRSLADDTAFAPEIWWYEVRNVLISAERRGRATEARSAAFLRALSRLPITVDHDPEQTVVLGLARRHGLTVYDAAYLELALRLRLPLATFDTALARAAEAEEVAAA